MGIGGRVMGIDGRVMGIDGRVTGIDSRVMGVDAHRWCRCRWVISVYFNLRNFLPNSGTFPPGHPV
jgi:hypothetical protein